MATAPKPTGSGFRQVGGILLTLTLAVLVSGLSSAPARADDRGHEDRGYQDNHHDRGRAHQSYRYEAPARLYAPPPVYYAPAPRRPVLDFFFTIH